MAAHIPNTGMLLDCATGEMKPLVVLRRMAAGRRMPRKRRRVPC